MESIYSQSSEIINNLLSSNIDVEKYELEMRFGLKMYEKFNTNVGRKLFDEIYSLVTNRKFYNIVENAFIRDKIFEGGIERRIKKVNTLMFDKKFYIKDNDVDVTTIKMNKEKINQYTYDYIRLSFNKENILEDLNTMNLKLERMKYRVSIMFEDIFRFDFTVVNQKDYSVEIEVLLPELKKIGKECFEEKFKKLTTLLSTIITKYNKNVIDNIKPQEPHTMSYSDLFTITSNKYTVTEKADGVRAFLKIKDKKAILINPKTNQIILDLGPTDLGDSLIDGEYVNNRLYAFDLIFFDGKDFRNSNLLDRLKILDVAISKITVGLIIKMKTFYTTDIFKNAKLILNSQHPYKIDGLIFTPIDQHYVEGIIQELPVFKWKKRHTIDVRVKYVKKDNFTYFIFGKKFGRINRWSQEFFEREYIRTRDTRTQMMHRLFNENQEYEGLRKNIIHFGKYKVYNSNIFYNGFLGKPGKPNEDHLTGRVLNRDFDVILDKFDIIEYEYRNGDWYPLRKRTFDKAEANAIKTIDGVLKVIEEDITINKMIKFENEYKTNESIGKIYNNISQDKSFKRDNWRKFHNFVKKETISNGSNNCIGGSYLDLACGKGGDIGKYIHLGYKNILAIDSSHGELYGKNGYIHRLFNFGFENKGNYFEKNDVKITVVWGDISKSIRNGDCGNSKKEKEKLLNFFTQIDKFNCVSIMFAIHYMFGDFVDNKWKANNKKINDFYINVVDMLDERDGKFIGTYLNDSTSGTFSNHGIPFYKITDNGDTIEINNDVWGWDNKISEPKISKNVLTELSSENGLVEIYNDSFESFYTDFKMKECILLSDDEQKLGYRNNYFIFVISPKKITKSIKL